MEASRDEIFDIFVSYRFSDGELISRKFADALKEMGYSVYHNSDRNHKGKFPDRLKRVIDHVRDFLLIVTEKCLEHLINSTDSDGIDWVKEELLEAIAQGKNIIPVMIANVDWPKNLSVLSNETTSLIRDLSERENIRLPIDFEKAPPLILLCGKLDSRPNAGGVFRNQKNDPKYVDVKKLLAQLTDEANNGNPVAMYQLAVLYRNGLGDKPRDSINEYYWLKKLIEINDESEEAKKYKAHAYWHLGGMYYNGEVPEERQSFEESYKCKEKASRLCPDDSSFNSSLMYMKSWVVGVAFDYEDIVRSFEAIDDLESAEASIILHQAEFYDRYGDFSRAIDLYLRVSHIYSGAAYRLGMLYLRGVDSNPPDPNGVSAAHYLQEAADMGSIEAAYELGVLYFRPPISKTRAKNVHQNIKKAIKYLKIAANINHTNAQYYLEWIYSHDLGISQDIAKAIEYGENAARSGSLNAMVTLIRLYQHEECKNYERACHYAVKAAEAYQEAALSAGYFFLFGWGCEPNLSEARKYFRMALKQHTLEAQYMLDLIHEIEEKGNLA
ncbi:MAG: toll/interleukin-1 receptor domain-containing protein [Synergistaceae bacterium]|nr:toll/interleukin-1 receptor domain-containing protein [Synergistaceae bacterium]